VKIAHRGRSRPSARACVDISTKSYLKSAAADWSTRFVVSMLWLCILTCLLVMCAVIFLSLRVSFGACLITLVSLHLDSSHTETSVSVSCVCLCLACGACALYSKPPSVIISLFPAALCWL